MTDPAWTSIMTPPLAVALPVAIGRILVIAISLVIWFWTQRLLARRNTQATAFDGIDAPDEVTSGNAAISVAICDRLHLRTAKANLRLNQDPRLARSLLISSSLVIDLLGLYMLGSAILGATFEPFLGLFMLFALRQIIQAYCPLPPPDGMIWRDTGFPTLLVTYGTSNDLFFSGHTAIAVYGAAMLASALGPPGIAIGIFIVSFEVAAVLLLRAHYTMDVFAGAVTALYIHRLAIDFAPTVDRWIGHVTNL
jgi:hypothetical protein